MTAAVAGAGSISAHSARWVWRSAADIGAPAAPRVMVLGGQGGGVRPVRLLRCPGWSGLSRAGGPGCAGNAHAPVPGTWQRSGRLVTPRAASTPAPRGRNLAKPGMTTADPG